MTHRIITTCLPIVAAVLIAVGMILMAQATPAGASGEWTDAQVSAALTQAANEHGVSRALLRCIAFYETGGSFDPATIGDSGESWGLFQLHRRGLRPTFVDWGYTDAFSPWQSADFTARYIARYGWAGARNWSPVLKGLC